MGGLSNRHCKILRADMSTFGIVEPLHGDLAARMHQGGDAKVPLASVFVTAAGTCNIAWPDGHLMATVVPNNPELFHPVSTEEEHQVPREQRQGTQGRVVSVA